MKLRPDCRKPDELRQISLEFPSRPGVVILKAGSMTVEAVVMETIIPYIDRHTRLLLLKSDELRDEFFLDRAVQQVLPPNELEIDENEARQITVMLSTLTKDSPAVPYQAAAAAAALLHYGLEIAFIPICQFEAGCLLDCTFQEGDVTLKCAFDKGGNVYLLLGELCGHQLHLERARELSEQLESAVLDDLEQRRLRRRAEYVIGE